ncbi:hypothetical protein GcC1_c17584o18 [Golovinomyces cichoracearum]|uniref:Uncharacterized protein n=1 Tax=Golovinomyces cichoracearum TaxID=62708 RepID=A0A420ITP6_9PEZI|nr:hypothetical protein GcC1_c17584o18 [Golovinomyces cichoracearum]
MNKSSSNTTSSYVLLLFLTTHSNTLNEIDPMTEQTNSYEYYWKCTHEIFFFCTWRYF